MFLPIVHKINMTTLASYYIIFREQIWGNYFLFFQSFDKLFFNLHVYQSSCCWWGRAKGVQMLVYLKMSEESQKKIEWICLICFTFFSPSSYMELKVPPLNPEQWLIEISLMWLQQSKIFKMLFSEAIWKLRIAKRIKCSIIDASDIFCQTQ